jgi:hypothetical protein
MTPSGIEHATFRLVAQRLIFFVEIFGTLKCTTTKATVDNEHAATLMAVACCVGWLQDAHLDTVARHNGTG